jgi:hypothetical protein
MVDMGSVDFLKITPIWGEGALSDRLPAKKTTNHIHLWTFDQR